MSHEYSKEERIRIRALLEEYMAKHSSTRLDRVDAILALGLPESELFASLDKRYKRRKVRPDGQCCESAATDATRTRAESERRAALKSRLVEFYERHCPTSVQERVRYALSLNVGEEVLFSLLYRRFNLNLKGSSRLERDAGSAGASLAAEKLSPKKELLRKRLIAFYKRHNPQKIGMKVQRALALRVEEKELFQALYRLYNLDDNGDLIGRKNDPETIKQTMADKSNDNDKTKEVKEEEKDEKVEIADDGDTRATESVMLTNDKAEEQSEQKTKVKSQKGEKPQRQQRQVCKESEASLPAERRELKEECVEGPETTGLRAGAKTPHAEKLLRTRRENVCGTDAEACVEVCCRFERVRADVLIRAVEAQRELFAKALEVDLVAHAEMFTASHLALDRNVARRGDMGVELYCDVLFASETHAESYVASLLRNGAVNCRETRNIYEMLGGDAQDVAFAVLLPVAPGESSTERVPVDQPVTTQLLDLFVWQEGTPEGRESHPVAQ